MDLGSSRAGAGGRAYLMPFDPGTFGKARAGELWVRIVGHTCNSSSLIARLAREGWVLDGYCSFCGTCKTVVLVAVNFTNAFADFVLYKRWRPLLGACACWQRVDSAHRVLRVHLQVYSEGVFLVVAHTFAGAGGRWPRLVGALATGLGMRAAYYDFLETYTCVGDQCSW